jgi:phage baseplate assembly protein W
VIYFKKFTGLVLMAITGWKFPINVENKTGKIQVLCDNDLIRQSVNIILKTQILERKIFPSFGSELRSFVFEIINANSISEFKNSIKLAIQNWEEHIKNIKINIRARTGPVSKIEAEIEYNTDISPVTERIIKKISMEKIT